MGGWLKERNKLAASIRDGKPAPVLPDPHLRLEEIKLCEAVFQHRSCLESASGAHIDDMAKALDRGFLRTPLDPVTVFWCGKHWYCIDGHHRIRAYIKALYCHPIPVQVFSGTLDEAIGKALQGNSKNKLPMSRGERSDGAWRVVISTQLSKAQTASAAGVSESTVANMRRVYDSLLKKGLEKEIDGFSWARAQLEAAGREAKAVDEDWIEKQAKEIADRLSKTFRDRLGQNPEVTARALEIYSTPLVAGLTEYWLSNVDDEEEDEDFE